MLTRWKCYSGCTDFEIADLFEDDGEMHRLERARAGARFPPLPFCSITHARIAEWNGISGLVDQHADPIPRVNFERRSA